MGDFFQDQIKEISRTINSGLNTEKMIKLLNLIGISNYSKDALEDIQLYSEFLPVAIKKPFSKEERYLHFLWEVFDKSPFSISISFAIPFRQIIAQKLFKKCGDNFICENNVTFNLGQRIEIGDDVFFNKGVYIDSKGEVKIGNSVGVAEDVKILTHSHSEADHALREYKPVIIKDFAKIYADATILPGVTIGKHSIVAAGAFVNKDVPDNSLVAGAPARVIRARDTQGKKEEELNHIWLGNAAFQQT